MRLKNPAFLDVVRLFSHVACVISEGDIVRVFCAIIEVSFLGNLADEEVEEDADHHSSKQ